MDGLSVGDLRAIMPEIVDALPDPERTVVTALFWERLSTRALAARMNCNHSTVVRVRDRAFKRIAALVEDYDGLDAEGYPS